MGVTVFVSGLIVTGAAALLHAADGGLLPDTTRHDLAFSAAVAIVNALLVAVLTGGLAGRLQRARPGRRNGPSDGEPT